MKNKFILVIVIFVILGIVISLGYILLANGKETSKEQSPVAVEEKEPTPLKSDDNKENYQEVVLDSKVGRDILESFSIRSLNFYSDALYDEMVQHGLSDKAKLMYAFLVATTEEKYQNLLETKEEYTGSVISQEDLESVMMAIFGKDTTVQHQLIYQEGTFVANEKCYALPAIGFGGINIEYTLEVPVSIKEYADRVEVGMQRVYLTMVNGVDTKEHIQVYLDRKRENLWKKFEDETFLESQDQTTILQKELEKAKLTNGDTATYTLKKQGESYVITDYANQS